MGVVFYNGTANQSMELVAYENNDEFKGPSIWDAGWSVVSGTPKVWQNPGRDYVQIRVQTSDSAVDGGGEAWAYLVTDLPTSGPNAWVYLGGSPGNWDFRVGAGHKCRVIKTIEAFEQWVDAETKKALKGKGVAGSSYDVWPPGFDMLPINGQPAAPRRMTQHVIAGRDGTVYLQKDGQLRRYRHQGFTNGAANFLMDGVITNGWAGIQRTLAVNDGYILAITDSGQLVRFQDLGHSSGAVSWANIGFAEVLSTEYWGNEKYLYVIAVTESILYTVEHNGVLRWWNHTGSGWASNSGTEVGTGWHKFLFVGAGSNGGVYAISRDGTLNWYQDRAWQTGTGNWVGPFNVGDGWHGFACVTTSNAGVLYTVSPDGSLSWYCNKVEARKEWDVALGVGTGWGA